MGDPDEVRVNSDERSFRKVWCQLEPPGRRLFADARRSTGTLTIGPNGVTFESAAGSWRSEKILAVDTGPAGNDIVNTWIVADVGEAVPGGLVFLNDGRWLGWHTLLTNTNGRMLQALRDLVALSGADEERAARVAAVLQPHDRLSRAVWKNPAWLVALVGLPMAAGVVLAARSGDWGRAALSVVLLAALLELVRRLKRQ